MAYTYKKIEDYRGLEKVRRSAGSPNKGTGTR